MMQDFANTLPANLQRPRTSRRSRPSLAAFADSGYAPSSNAPADPSSSRHATLTRANARNTLRTLNIMREDVVADGSDPVDLGVASQLTEGSFARGRSVSFRTEEPPTLRSILGFDGEQSGTTRGGTMRKISAAKFTNDYPTHRLGSSGSSQYAKTSTRSRSATISSAWSGVSNRLFVEAVKESGSEDDQANTFTESFDSLAKKHGIQPFPKTFSEEPKNVSVSSASGAASPGDPTPTMTGNKFLNKLLRRTSSTMDVSKHHGNTKLTKRHRRNSGVNDLDIVGRGKRNPLKGMHLEDMIRLGGVAIFNLPLGLSPGDLLIPTCMHAAASYILNNGIRKQGIFRVSGNINTTFALYDFYQRQLEENNNESVVATTALARLPTNIQYNVHDVAHLLKKLLYGLPGGLLGKPAVFQALYNVHTFVYPDPSLGDEMSLKVKPRMIALAISSINLHFRIALICAVFGLLRTINLASEQETVSKVKDPHETYIQMRDDSLGTVFAPLLLGDKSQHILVDDNEDRGGLLVLPTADQNGHGTSSRKDRPDLHEAKKEAERMRRAAMVAQMLIDNWEDIAYQMKRINTLGITAQAYDIPVSQPQNTLQRAGTFRYRGKGQPQLGPLKTEYVPIADKFATVRSTRLEEPLYSNSQPQSRQTSRGSDHSRNWSGQYDSIRSQPQTGDLLRFDSQKSNRKALDQDLFKPPLNLADTLGMSPIAESVATRSISTPVTKEPASTPNWRAFSDPPTRLASPFRPEATSSPNWRNFGASSQFGLESSPNWRNPQTPTQTGSQASPNWRNIQTPSQLASESSPNWRDARTPDRSGPETSPNWQQFATPSEGGLHGSPNWRKLATPSEPEPHATPNWLALAPPSEVDLLATPNWLSLAPPSELDLLATPNWRLLATDDESYRPDTPVKKFRIPYAETETEPEPELEADKVSLSSSRAGSAHSSGTSSGARTPPQEVTPQIARRITTQFSTASISSFNDVILGDSLALSAPPELDTPEAEKRKPSIYGRRAISPEPELTLRKDSRGTFGDSEQVDEYLDEYRPTTPKPLNFRKKQSSFSIYEDHPDKTPKGQRPTIPVNSPVLSLRKPNSQVDIKISPNGKKASPSRPLPESPAHSQSAPLHTATSNRRARASTVNDVEASCLPKELGSPSSPGKKSRGGGNTALYAEIQRLQRLVDLKTEEANSTRKELELAQRMANAGTLSQILRETQEELKVWKNRAEWAEKQLKQKNTSRDSEIKRTVIHGHATRYSVS